MSFVFLDLFILSKHKSNQQRVQMYATRGGNIPEDTPKTGDGWQKKDVCNYNDASAHMGQVETELV